MNMESPQPSHQVRCLGSKFGIKNDSDLLVQLESDHRDTNRQGFAGRPTIQSYKGVSHIQEIVSRGY